MRHVTILLVLVSAGVLTVLVAAFISWSSNRSPLFNMLLGILFGFAAIIGAVILAWLITRAALPY